MNNIKILFLFSILLSLFTSPLSAQSRQEFVQKHKQIAIQEMRRTGIPASIKLAQGILESGCGQSDLCTEANNYFGIKCHNTWEGETFHQDDDEENECFRSYTNPADSWYDHSEFLTSRPRYASLFELSSKDYRGWARGLKQAGYATNPAYADLLIKIIEEEELYRYDVDISDKQLAKNDTPKQEKHTNTGGAAGRYKKREEIRNGVVCIEAQKGDSYEKISRYYGIKQKKLLAFNDQTNTSLKEGDIVYIKNKKAKAAKGYDFHRVKEGDTPHSIAQQYGVKMKSLLKYNYITQDTNLVEGEKIYLRYKTKI